MPSGAVALAAGSRLSDEALLLIAPFRGYELIAARPSRGVLGVLRRCALTLCVIGVTGAITTAGRLVPAHVLLVAAAWAFVPVLQIATVAAVSRRCTRSMTVARAVDLHMAGNGAYAGFFFALSAVVLFAPDVADAFSRLLSWAILPVAIVAMLFGGSLTSYAFYRVCGGDSRKRALVLLLIEWLLKVSLCLVWYHLMDNLAPQFLGQRGAP
ncbi:MAG: hypothetical protein HOV80_34015 [Polyangiaceae bacterium]|nr:hypothetical protein [Polyangiaceae bacterium]